MIRIPFKKLHPDAVEPTYAKLGDAGMDLTAISHVSKGIYDEYGTGIALEIPEGYVGLIYPRSSVSGKSQILANSVGVIDSGYRGELKLRFKTLNNVHTYAVGDKIGQLVIMPVPAVTLIETQELSETARGEGGFGSTGK